MLTTVAMCYQERLAVAREKTALENAQNAALCSVCRTPVRDAPANTSTPPAVQSGMTAPG